ncbi:polymorphic toxin type 24 domain-containing protein [Pseudomonas sp. RL_105y_Pfl1_103]|uniref:polymorphic toxin type 24 domain-containing protein n=1 Tax=unclassified Pseudomonas TaxID=196821 RepID=UPI0030D6FBF3
MPYAHPVKEAGPKGSTSFNSVPRNANDLAGGPLENATQISGRFKLDGGPANGAVYRADNQGNITSYAVYDSAGMIVKRVDVTGAAHADVSTPHVGNRGQTTFSAKSIQVFNFFVMFH